MRACQTASMMLVDTPIVVHARSPSVESIEHAHDGVGVGLGVEDAHPVVGEVDVGELRVRADEQRRAARGRAR